MGCGGTKISLNVYVCEKIGRKRWDREGVGSKVIPNLSVNSDISKYGKRGYRRELMVSIARVCE